MNKLIIAAYVVATAGGLVLLKLGTSGAGFLSIVDGKFTWNISLLTALGIATYGISFLLYIILISKFELGYIVPLTTALVYILVFSASYFIFKEHFTAVKIIAIVMIMGGAILLNSAPSKPATVSATQNQISSKDEDTKN